MLVTERLILRPWREEDKEPFARMNANPEVMRYFSSILSREESDAQVEWFDKHMSEYGYCMWVAEEKETGDFAGFVGLNNIGHDLPFTPAVEIGWRLSSAYWGKGYATEAAQASLKDGFDRAGLGQIVAYTAQTNLPSIAVMKRLGMNQDKDGGFLHPELPEDHVLRPHVLYRLNREDYSF